MNNLKSLIQNKGYEWNGKRGNSLTGFAEDVFNTNYRNLNNWINKESFTYDQIKIILKALDCRFDELEVFKPKKRKAKRLIGSNSKKEHITTEREQHTESREGEAPQQELTEAEILYQKVHGKKNDENTA